VGGGDHSVGGWESELRGYGSGDLHI
jgi:hypothetical protein